MSERVGQARPVGGGLDAAPDVAPSVSVTHAGRSWHQTGWARAAIGSALVMLAALGVSLGVALPQSGAMPLEAKVAAGFAGAGGLAAIVSVAWGAGYSARSAELAAQPRPAEHGPADRALTPDAEPLPDAEALPALEVQVRPALEADHAQQLAPAGEGPDVLPGPAAAPPPPPPLDAEPGHEPAAEALGPGAEAPPAAAPPHQELVEVELDQPPAPDAEEPAPAPPARRPLGAALAPQLAPAPDAQALPGLPLTGQMRMALVDLSRHAVRPYIMPAPGTLLDHVRQFTTYYSQFGVSGPPQVGMDAARALRIEAERGIATLESQAALDLPMEHPEQLAMVDQLLVAAPGNATLTQLRDLIIATQALERVLPA